MEQVKHTPGPWTQGWSKNGIDCVWLDGKTEPVSGMGDDNDWIDCVTEANARLISAAPDMLEALQELADLVEAMRNGEYKPDSFTTQPAYTAIAKALGE